MAELYFRSGKAVLENTLSNHQALGSGIPGEALLFAGKSSHSVQWYAVSVRPRHEKLVTRHLEHQGLNHFLPVYRSVRRWKDRHTELDMALCPLVLRGWLFTAGSPAPRSAARYHLGQS